MRYGLVVSTRNRLASGVREIIKVLFPRPRSRAELTTNPMYTKLRERLVYLLTDVLAVKDVA